MLKIGMYQKVLRAGCDKQGESGVAAWDTGRRVDLGCCTMGMDMPTRHGVIVWGDGDDVARRWSSLWSAF